MGAETAFEVGRLYSPIKAISDILTSPAQDIFIQLPGIQGYYPMSIVSNSGTAINHSGAGGPLIETGVVPVGYDGNAYRQLGNGTNYLAATGVYGLTGTETYIDTSIRGFTIGGWFNLNSWPATISGLISKSGPSPQNGYALIVQVTGEARFFMSGTGITILNAIGPILPLSEWHFIVGRYTPSVEVAVFVDAVKVTNSVSIPASCFVSSQAFEVGRYFNSNSRIIDGKARDVFICRAALSDAIIESIRAATSP